VGDVLIDNVTFEVFIINNYGLVKCVKVVRWYIAYPSC
jgi:hypothetical protein